MTAFRPWIPGEPPHRILVLCTRRLGDVLLATALLRTLRRAWPQAELDVLTLKWSAPALEGNPDVTRILSIAEAAGMRETLSVLGAARRYDLAVSTLHADRPHFLALWAGRRRVTVVPPGQGEGRWWKQRLSSGWTARDGRLHMVAQYLALADCLGIPRHLDLVPPRAAQPHRAIGKLRAPYAVVHPAPMYRYKRWTLEGWRSLVEWLTAQGLSVVLTGGPSNEERAYVAQVMAGQGPGVTSLAGELAFAQLTAVLERASLFIGPDTSVTHLASASGANTVALFGPTTPIAWGPWPRGLQGSVASPWREHGPLQQQGNVWLVQGVEHCVPCHLEGCDRHRDSRADCLDFLPAARVIAVADAALRRPSRQV